MNLPPHHIEEIYAMKKLNALLAKRRNSQKGATVIEYALIAALIAIAAIVAMGSVGTKVTGVFDKVANTMTT